MWVVLYHMTQMPAPHLATPMWGQYAENGHAGVMLFFVASAFSLCYASRFHQEGWIAFYIRRFFRIAPLFYAVLAVILLRMWVIDATTRPLTEVLDNILFTFNILPEHQWGIVPAGWTIGVEMIFYLIFPALYLASGNIWRAVTAMMLSIIIARVFDNMLPSLVNNQETYRLLSFFHHLPTFVSGLVAFRLYESLKGHSSKNDVGLTLITGAAVLYFALLDNRTALVEPYYWQGIIFGTFVVGLALSPTSILVNRVTAFLGKISYSTYLLHSPIIVWLMPVYAEIYSWPAVVSFKFLTCAALTLAVLVPISYAAFRLIEQPGINWGRRIVDRRISASKGTCTTVQAPI